MRGSDQNAFRWLRSKPSIRSHAVFKDANQEKGPIEDSVHQALETIAQFSKFDRKSMMLHGAVWRCYVHLWATYMKLLV